MLMERNNGGGGRSLCWPCTHAEMPPKYSVGIMEYIKGKSSLLIYEKRGNTRHRYWEFLLADTAGKMRAVKPSASFFLSLNRFSALLYEKEIVILYAGQLDA